MLRLLETEEGRDRTETIRRKLALLRDIRSTIERTGGNCVFDDIELFELKFFALLAEELRPLASQGHLAELPELNGVVDLLDPEGNRLPHFFVYDAYSEELTTLRKQIKARKQAGADESQTTPPLAKGRLGGVMSVSRGRLSGGLGKREYKISIKSIIYITLILLVILHLFDFIWFFDSARAISEA